MDQLSYFVISGLCNFLTAGAIAAFFIYRKSKYIYFILFNLAVALWSLFYVFWQLSTVEYWALLNVRLFMLFVIFIPHFFSIFMIEYSENKAEKWVAIVKWINYLFISVYIPITLFTTLLISSLEPVMDFLFWPKAGILLAPFLLYFGGNVFLGLYLLFKKYLATSKGTYLWLMIFTGIAFFGGSTNYFLWYDIPIKPYLNISITFYAFLMGIYMTRSELMDIKLVLNKTASIFILIPAVIFSYIFLLNTLMPIDNHTWIYVTALTFGWLALGPKVASWIQAPITQQVQRHTHTQNRLRELDQIESELKKAREIQFRVLPQATPHIQDVRVDTRFLAARTVSGDYYHFINLSDHEFVVIISDMLGKGIVAALYMFIVHGLLQQLGGDLRSPSDCLNRLNNIIEQDNLVDKYVPLTYLYINSQTKIVKYANAGNESFFIARENTLKEYESMNVPLGMCRDEQYEETEIKVQSGDKIVLYTDGFTDVTNEKGERYGIERVKSSIQSAISQRIFESNFIERLFQSWQNFSNPDSKQDDDMTIITVELV